MGGDLFGRRDSGLGAARHRHRHRAIQCDNRTGLDGKQLVVQLDHALPVQYAGLHRGEQVARLCFVNPRTTMDHVRAVLGTM